MKTFVTIVITFVAALIIIVGVAMALKSKGKLAARIGQ